MINDKLTKELQEQITENKDDITGNKTYSTNETNTHKKWINGKTIYRKVKIINSTDFVNNKDIPLNISNMDDVIKMDILQKNTNDNGWRNIPWVYATQQISIAWTGGVFVKENGNIFFQLGTSLQQISKIIVILEYTKTTD